MNKPIFAVLLGLLFVAVLVMAQDDDETDDGSDLNEARDARQVNDDDYSDPDLNAYRDARGSVKLYCNRGQKPVRVRGGRYICKKIWGRR